MTKVVIMMGSASDRPVTDKAENILAKLGIEHECYVASAHRTPDKVRELIEKTGAEVFIAVAGLSAALPGVVAAHTLKPVIGVPCTSSSSPGSLDSLLSVVQMPPGIPVAAVGLNRGDNAALLAAEIIALSDENVKNELKAYREEMAQKTLDSNERE